MYREVSSFRGVEFCFYLGQKLSNDSFHPHFESFLVVFLKKKRIFFRRFRKVFVIFL